jgi:transcriptional regulator with XRE-family HTH domain
MQDQSIGTSYSVILGQMIRKLREQNNADQGDLATHMGVSTMTISRIESGDTVLDVPQMEEAAKFFNISPQDFFADSLKAKQEAEKKYKVFQNKKAINKESDIAVIGLAAIVGIVAAVLLSRK